MNYFDEKEIRKTIALMKSEDELFEIRILQGKKPITGYFKDADTLIKELKKQDLKGANVYITVNEPNEACYAREQRNKLMQVEKTTSDTDIYAYDWLMIDLDPKRPSGVSSSDAELKLAKDLGNKIYKYMQGLGFEKPLMAMSGNGVHLLYRVNLGNTKENQELIKTSLKALHLMFSTDEIEVDQKNFNPGRVCKLYGTLAQKGMNVEERPHRMSHIVGNDKEIKASDVQYLKKLCEVIPKEPEKPQKYNNYQPRDFDLEAWLDKYGLRYSKKSWGDADKYVLDECPFDSNHKAPDACILKFRNGAISFTCFHNSCADHKWQDLRMLYEPDAYEKKNQWNEQQMFNSFNRDKKLEVKHIEKQGDKPIFYTAMDVLKMPDNHEEIIKSGIKEYDRRFRGLRKKDMTILSGQTGSAKSTFLSQVILNAIDGGNNVACFSGELGEKDYMCWMNLQAAGKAYVEPTQYENCYAVPYRYQERIAKWLEGKFWLYNNDYGYNFSALLEQFESMIEEHKLDLLCIDNLMALDISDLAKEKYDAQTVFAWRLHDLAKKKDVHIMVVCHPRKPTGLLGMYDVSGTADLVNATDNIIFVYRNNQSFQNAYKQFTGFEWTGTGTNIWHCAKARFGSTDDAYNELYYEPETKRLKNELTENRVYGWNESKQMVLPLQEPEFEDANIDEIPFD